MGQGLIQTWPFCYSIPNTLSLENFTNNIKHEVESSIVFTSHYKMKNFTRHFKKWNSCRNKYLIFQNASSHFSLWDMWHTQINFGGGGGVFLGEIPIPWMLPHILLWDYLFKMVTNYVFEQYNMSNVNSYYYVSRQVIMWDWAIWSNAQLSLYLILYNHYKYWNHRWNTKGTKETHTSSLWSI